MKRNDERGVITSMFAVFAIFFVLIIAMVAEGGRKLSNLGQAEDVAAEAARAAAATLDNSKIPNGVAEIDLVNNRARVAAEAIVSFVPNAQIEEFTATPQSVLVVVRVSGDSFVPGFSIDGVGRHRALAFDPFPATP